VKERKITIPMKRFQREEEDFSPLLRKKRQKRKENENVAKPDNLDSAETEERDVINLQPSDTKEVKEAERPKPQEPDEELLIKEREADSLALLISSLHLPAEKAIPLLEAAVKYAYNNLSAAEYLSYLYLEVEQPKQCLELCNKILEQLEDRPQANELSIHINNNKAAALNMLGRYSESIGILEKCLAFAKRDVYYKNLGDAYFSIAIFEKAIFNYESALRLNNQMEEAYYNLAVCYYMQEHLHEAQLNISEALKINPTNPAYLRLSE
jgi:tetratricopeptide (TPR) repeat protein